MTVPFGRKCLVHALQAPHKPSLGWAFLVAVVHSDPLPLKAIPVLRKAEAIEEMLATNERHVPQAWRASPILLDWDLLYEFLKKLRGFVVALFVEMLPQASKRRKLDRRTNEEHRLALQSTKDDLVWRSDAVDVRRNVCDDKITRIDHA